jgi:hypothetical protein
MRDLFSEDAVWESDGFGVFRGRAQILAGLREIARTRVSHTSHYMIAPLVDVGSDRRSARASWRLWELAHLRDGTGSKFHQVMAGGDYTCKLLRIDGKWRLQHVRLNISTVVRCSPFSNRHAAEIAAVIRLLPGKSRLVEPLLPLHIAIGMRSPLRTRHRMVV